MERLSAQYILKRMNEAKKDFRDAGNKVSGFKIVVREGGQRRWDCEPRCLARAEASEGAQSAGGRGEFHGRLPSSEESEGSGLAHSANKKPVCLEHSEHRAERRAGECRAF